MDAPQPELPLPFPAQAGDMPLLPARMVNEYQYCPRLAYLEWVQGEWSDSSDRGRALPPSAWTGPAADCPMRTLGPRASVFMRAR